jgi:uncharacterized protein (TIGR02246 family)
MFLAAVAVAVALAASSGACVSTGGSNAPVSDGPDVVAISAVWDTYVRGINASDLDLWISLWDENGIQFPPDEAMHRGKAEILAANVEFFPAFDMKMKISPQEITVIGGYAYSSGSYVLEMSERGSDSWMRIDGKFLTILRKQADGSWKLWRDCFNSDPAAE